MLLHHQSSEKIDKKSQWVIFYVKVTCTLASRIIPFQAIGLPIFFTSTRIIRFIHFNDNLLAKQKIVPVGNNNKFDKIIYQKIITEEFNSIISRYLKSKIDEHELDLIVELKGIDEFDIMVVIISINWLD